MSALIPKVYVGDVGTVLYIDLQEVITGATGLALYVKKPDRSIVTWTPSVDGTQKLKYTAQSGDFDMVGKYYIQPRLILSGWTGRGNTIVLEVFELFD